MVTKHIWWNSYKWIPNPFFKGLASETVMWDKGMIIKLLLDIHNVIPTVSTTKRATVSHLELGVWVVGPGPF